MNLDSTRDARSYRLSNIDMLRGLVIVIMALDHTRDLVMAGAVLDVMTQPDVPLSLYLTRWVTHFCASVFVFLAGTSAGLMAARKSKAELGGFLLKRGLWLIFVEVAIISTAVTWSPIDGVAEVGGYTFLFVQVIWAIGASMVVLAALQWLGAGPCLALGLLIILGHNALDGVWPQGDLMGGDDPFWITLKAQGSLIIGPFYLAMVYPLIPWVGVMLLGFGTAFIFQKPPAERDALLLRAGIAMVLLFLLVRASSLYGDPNPWQVQDTGTLRTILDFMNVTKYPPSFLFLLATLGPMMIFCSYADRMSGWLKDTLVMFGRVPFAFYIAHFYLLRVFAHSLAAYQGVEQERMMTFVAFFPAEYGVNLAGVYVAWLLLLAILYPFCKWFAAIKASRKDWWLSYL